MSTLKSEVSSLLLNHLECLHLLRCAGSCKILGTNIFIEIRLEKEGRNGFLKYVQKVTVVSMSYHLSCVKRNFYCGRNGMDSKILSTKIFS